MTLATILIIWLVCFFAIMAFDAWTGDETTDMQLILVFFLLAPVVVLIIPTAIAIAVGRRIRQWGKR